MAEELIAVEGDKIDDHKEGAFKTPQKTTVKIANKPVIVKDDEAYGDNSGHTDTQAETGSGTVFAYNKKIHRNNDQRHCGGKTKAEGQTTVKAG